MVRWFDRWLKDVDNGVDREPALRLYMGGTGKWIEPETWPPPEAVTGAVPRSRGRAGAGSLNGGRLADAGRSRATRPTGTATTRRPTTHGRRPRRRHLDVAVRATRPARGRGAFADLHGREPSTSRVLATRRSGSMPPRPPSTPTSSSRSTTSIRTGTRRSCARARCAPAPRRAWRRPSCSSRRG